MLKLGFGLGLFLSLSFLSNFVQAAVLPIDDGTRTYCVGFGKYGVDAPGVEALAKSLLGQNKPDPAHELRIKKLSHQVLDFLFQQGLYTAKTKVSILLNYCGPQMITMEMTDSIANKISEHFKSMDVAVKAMGEPQVDPIPQAIKEKVLAEGNQIIKEAVERLMTDPNVNPTELGQTYRARLEKWEDEKTDIGNGVMRHNSIILQQGSVSTTLRQELTDVVGAVRKLREFRQASLKEQLKQAIERLQPIADVQSLEALKAIMPDQINILNEQQKKAEYLHSLGHHGRIVELKLKIIEDALFLNFMNIQHLSEYSAESYELFAKCFYEKLEALDLVMNEYEIADVINRTLVTMHPPENPRQFGPQMQKLFAKLASYNGLINYVHILLKAVMANTGPQAVGPTAEEFDAYQIMWNTMPMKPLMNDYEGKVPRMHYGPLGHIRGPLDYSIVDGVIYIEKWLRAYSHPTVNWVTQKGITLDELREHFREYRKMYLNSKDCSGFLEDESAQ